MRNAIRSQRFTRPAQSGTGAVGESSMESGDWRAQLQADSRQRIVNKIMDTLKRHIPVSGHEGLQDLKKIAVRFEEKIYTAATSQSDYLRKISLKMLTMETGPQNPFPNALQSSSAANVINPSDPGSSMEAGDWKAQLHADSRERIVNKIMDTLKRHILVSGHEGLQELKKIAVRFEEKIYIAATSQSDYLRKISIKMLSMETRSQNPMPDALHFNYDPDLSMEPGDWKAQLPADSRERMVNKIMKTLKKHIPYYGDEGLQEIKCIAERFEDNVFTTATSQNDYLQKLSLKMLDIERMPQIPIPNM